MKRIGGKCHCFLTSSSVAVVAAAVREHVAVAAGLSNRLWPVRGRGVNPSDVS